jgi:hypothetical protein
MRPLECQQHEVTAANDEWRYHYQDDENDDCDACLKSKAHQLTYPSHYQDDENGRL